MNICGRSPPWSAGACTTGKGFSDAPHSKTRTFVRASKSFEVAEKVLRRAPEGRGFSPSAKRAPTHSTICGQGAVAPVGANRE